jgi:hypothetical protein
MSPTPSDMSIDRNKADSPVSLPWQGHSACHGQSDSRFLCLLLRVLGLVLWRVGHEKREAIDQLGVMPTFLASWTQKIR